MDSADDFAFHCQSASIRLVRRESAERRNDEKGFHNEAGDV
jgi:hypothetical protein